MKPFRLLPSSAGAILPGLALLGSGWACLVAAGLVPDRMLHLGPLPLDRRDLVPLGQSAIVTGLGLLLLVRLTRGFGALDRFFAAALERAERRAPRPPEPVAALNEGAPAARLSLAGHDLIVLPDGAVLLETVLGMKRFGSLDEAFAFVRSLPRAGMPDIRRQNA